MQYLLARLREPGTLRSLAVVLFALLGLSPDDPRLEGAIQIAILALGTISALLPEKKVDPQAVAETVAPAVAAEVKETLAEVAPVGSALRAGLNRITGPDALRGSAREGK